MTHRDPVAMALGASIAVIVAAAALTLQNLRDGWPFAPSDGPPARTPAAVDQRSGTGPVHPRAAIDVDPAKLGSLGVLIERAAVEAITQPVRAVATVVPDKSRLVHVHTRVAG